jgi:hypothetical protein
MIQYFLEIYNQEVGYAQITEINLIPAEVKIIKCKIDNLSFDISLNNFVGLFKLSLMTYLETKSFDKIIFKRTLFLVKCWSYYEGNILGSNVGLMASYALEVLIIYMFNKFSHKFTNEIEATLFFFNMINEIDWNKNIVTVFGTVSIDTYHEDLKNNNFNLNELLRKIIEKFSKINLDEIINFTKNFEKFDKFQNLGKKSIDMRLMNIIDPIFHSNNLGKSLNYHNFSKIKKIFEFAKEDADVLRERKKNFSITAFEYLNSLTKIFSKVMINNCSDLFYLNLPQPKIIIFPQYNNLEINYEDSQEDQTNTPKEDLSHDMKKLKIQTTSGINNQILVSLPNKLDEELIKKFTENFSDCIEKNSGTNNENISVVNKEYSFINNLWPSK